MYHSNYTLFKSHIIGIVKRIPPSTRVSRSRHILLMHHSYLVVIWGLNISESYIFYFSFSRGKSDVFWFTIASTKNYILLLISVFFQDRTFNFSGL